LTATCIFVFRKRQKSTLAASEQAGGRIALVPGHPLTTILFVAACWLVVINTVYRYPENTLIGLGILMAGIPAFFFWRWRNRQ